MQYINFYASILDFRIPISLICIRLIALSCSDAGMFVLLTLMAHHLCFLSHPWMTNSTAVHFVPQSLWIAYHGVWALPKHWDVHLLGLLSRFSSAVMESNMSEHDSIALMVMCVSNISFSLFVLYFTQIADLWWIFIAIHCIVFGHYSGVFFEARSFLNITRSSLWSMTTSTSQPKQ